jgi:pimeloyl-ACP methyl ester carboxylesterase
MNEHRRSILKTLAAAPLLPLALSGCQGAKQASAVASAAATSPITPLPDLLPAGIASDGVIIRRQYVDGPFGQIHMHVARPVRSAALQRRPLVCFHPTAVSGHYYRDLMLRMGRDRLVIAPDTPGYGRSDPPPEPQSMKVLAQSAAAALDALGFGRRGEGAVDMLGFHTGVFLATELAIERPDLVHRLVLPGIPFYEPAVQKEKYAQYAKAVPFDEAGSKVRKEWAFWVEQRDPRTSVGRGAENFADQLQSLDRGWWAYHSVFSYPAQDRLPLVRQPVLVPLIADSLQLNTLAATALFANVTVEDLTDIQRSFFVVGADRLASLCRRFLDSGTAS